MSGQSIDEDADVISFFRFGKYKKYENESKKIGKYDVIEVQQLYNELLDAFLNYVNQEDSWENDNYEQFRATNKEIYGYEKEIYISNRSEQKCLRCTLTNMDEQEKDLFIKIVQKYCNHIATR